MDLIVCIKRVPQTAEAEVRVDSSGKDIVKDRLTFDMNEADTYALEAAILLKEKFGGTITAISLGVADAEDTLRIALAKGADSAVRIKAEDFGELDGFKTAALLKEVIKDIKFDAIFTGCMATDDSYYQVGPVLAEMLGVPHATLVSKVEVSEEKVRVNRELEGGLIEHLEMSLPAVFAVQTGINEPRYASLIAIRRAAGKEIKILGKEDIPVETKTNSTLEELFVPPVGKRAEILTGSADEVAARTAGIIKEKGLI
ncbi:MAG: electron transfer flavoprotein subunit beta/FixA family protein [candidate division WOR-3 bacterium]|nr:MAG: electron transfer flavoprotein subunit beta/FixA family protein [candidate division WOR-3 bacterium]